MTDRPPVARGISLLLASSPLPRASPRPDAHRGALRGLAPGPSRFAMALERARVPDAPPERAPRGPRLTESERPPETGLPSRGRPARERDPQRLEGLDAELVPFRPLPSIVSPPLLSSAPIPARTDLGRLAEQLVTRLRVGRSRDGALVELRVLLPGLGELDLRVVESSAGVEVHADDASPELRAAIGRELHRRGLDARVSG